VWRESRRVDLGVADYELDGEGAESSVTAAAVTDFELLFHLGTWWLLGRCVVGVAMLLDMFVGEHDLALAGQLSEVPCDTVGCVVASRMPSVMDVDVEFELTAQHAPRCLHADGGSSASSTFRQGSLLVYSGDRIIFMLPREGALGKV